MKYKPFLKTYSLDKHVPDSASTANALFSGVKTNFEVIGYNGRVRPGEAENAAKENELATLLDWAQEKGMETGKVFWSVRPWFIKLSC